MSTMKMEQKNTETQSAAQQQNKFKDGDGSLYKDDKESESPLDLSPHPPTRLPLELECEIYKCLKEEIQTKFIWGMGRGIYGIFRHRLLVKTKKLCNPKANNWKWNQFSYQNLGQDNFKNIDSDEWGLNVFAQKGFPISVEECRLQNNFPGTILYYFEITNTSAIWCRFFVGLSNGCVPNDSKIGKHPNSYAIPRGSDYCTLSGNRHWFKFPDGPIGGWRGCGDVYGCGLVMDPTDKLAIFFTLNGTLIDEQIPMICPPSLTHLFPTVSMWNSSLEANFGDDPSKPFKLFQ